MYRKLIEGLIRNVEWAGLEKPCPEAEIEKAEAYIGCRFPEELRALLRETNGDHWLLLSAGQIIENARCNREILSGAFENAELFQEKVDRYIFFATNGCGDYYCYRILQDGSADAAAIYIWEHESFESRIVAGNIPQLITRYYQDEL